MTLFLDPEYLRSQFEYNENTGALYWKAPGKGRQVGARAGAKRSTGYWVVSLGGNTHYQHRIAYAIYHGANPDGHIDHANGDTSDNSIENLRLTSPRLNHQNRSAHRAGKLVGATLVKSTGRWQAAISVENRSIHLGTFATEQEAHEAYLRAQRLFREHDIA